MLSSKNLRNIFTKKIIEISKDGVNHLIGKIFKTKRGHKVSKTQGISYSRIREVFKDYITDITANPEKYSLHSLRAEGASAAASNGVTDRLMSKKGRARNGFIKDSVSTRLSVFKMLRL